MGVDKYTIEEMALKFVTHATHRLVKINILQVSLS